MVCEATHLGDFAICLSLCALGLNTWERGSTLLFIVKLSQIQNILGAHSG